MHASSGHRPSTPVWKSGRAAGTALLLLALLPARALAAAEDDRDFELTAAISLTNEDNIFRLPEAGEPEGDMYRSAWGGISFSYPLSKQRLVGEARLSTIRYDTFEELDHEAWSLRGAWLWQVGTRLDGQVGVTAQSALASLANLNAGEQSTIPNELRVWRFDADGGYVVAGRWQLRGSFNRIVHENGSAEFESSDMTRDELGATLVYLRPSGSRVGLNASYAEARLPNPQLIGVLTRVDNSHTQRRYGGLLDWVPTDKSRLALRGGYVGRRYRQFQERDYDGWSGSISYEWRASEKTMVTAVVRRDISETEQVNVGYVIARAAALQPAFQMGDKTYLALNFEVSERSFRGDVALGQPAQTQLREVVGLVGANLDLQATDIFGLRLFGRHEFRRANSDFPDYRAAIIGAELRATF
jgi:exopolysaccharide biosynthesis operon protein EpsL